MSPTNQDTYQTKNRMQTGFVNIAGKPVPIINGLLTVPTGTVVESANLERVIKEQMVEEQPQVQVSAAPAAPVPSAPPTSNVTPSATNPPVTIISAAPDQSINSNTTENK